MQMICILLPPPEGNLPPDIRNGLGSILLADKVSIAKAIFENIYPGSYPDIHSGFMVISECYYQTDVWFIISALGRNHRSPFRELNGVLYTWTDYRFFRRICTRRSGISLQRQASFRA